jgi:hypothetical protein
VVSCRHNQAAGIGCGFSRPGPESSSAERKDELTLYGPGDRFDDFVSRAVVKVPPSVP